MSTKIYNGFKFNTNNIFKVYEYLSDFKEISKKNLMSKFNDSYLSILKNIMTKYYLEYDKFQSIWELDNVFIEEIKKPHYFLYLKNYIQIYPDSETNEIYGYYILDSESEQHIIRNDWFIDFHYQNQTDIPDNITEDEYEHRKEVWDRVLASDYLIKNSGIMFNILDITDINFSLNEIFNKRVKMLEKNIVRELKMKNICNEK